MPPDQSNINNLRRTCIFRYALTGTALVSAVALPKLQLSYPGPIFDIYDNAWGKIMRCLPGAECRVNAEIQNQIGSISRARALSRLRLSSVPPGREALLEARTHVTSNRAHD